ncbi:DUF4214 domain-containing protein [Streptomyces sp. TLI_146]|uniref:DUF4214 domain-containing protein n=1 Tax=Streptomyces sp. TLI_146 TaxID=1938858 RepID=UPI0015D60020|nr:DUF4214 domain-containing protein [Streptomyces sp. TLI_146]
MATVFVSLIPGVAEADIRRPNNAETEIESYYREFLGRPSDPGGFTSYRDRMWSDCKFGVLAAGMMIGDSQEAHNRLRSPRPFVAAMYRALLNRNADPGGLQTYVNVVNTRGYRWAIRDIQASGEFHNRLNAMCQGRRGSMTQNELKPDQAVSAAIGINDAGMTLIKACAVGSVIGLVGGLTTRGLYEAGKAIKAAKLALGAAIQKGAAGDCLSAYQVLQAADDVVESARYEPAATSPGYNNPTYVYLNQWHAWKWNGRWCHVQMGAGSSAPERSWREVKFRC